MLKQVARQRPRRHGPAGGRRSVDRSIPGVTAVGSSNASGRAGTTDPALARLTPQERRILALIGEGMTNRQIADTLFLAEKTVKNYVSSMLGKLDMGSRTQAALFAAKREGADRRS